MLLAPVQRGINYLLKIMIKQMYTSKNDDHRLDKESGSITNANNSYEVNDVCKWLLVSHHDPFIFHVHINKDI